jgi:DNA-binding transcriptional ArsR family regulator
MNEASFYRCLADGTRLAVLHHLAREGPASVSQLADATDQEQSNLSHHLAELRDCGLAVADREGKRRLYRLAHPRLADLLEEGAWLVDHIEASDPEACRAEGSC